MRHPPARMRCTGRTPRPAAQTHGSLLAPRSAPDPPPEPDRVNKATKTSQNGPFSYGTAFDLAQRFPGLNAMHLEGNASEENLCPVNCLSVPGDDGRCHAAAPGKRQVPLARRSAQEGSCPEAEQH